MIKISVTTLTSTSHSLLIGIDFAQLAFILMYVCQLANLLKNERNGTETVAMNFSRTDWLENRNWTSLINRQHHQQQVVAQYVYENSENENKKTQRIHTFVLWTIGHQRWYSSLISKGRTNRRFEKRRWSLKQVSVGDVMANKLKYQITWLCVVQSLFWCICRRKQNQKETAAESRVMEEILAMIEDELALHHIT